MADETKAPEEPSHFEDTVQADLAIEQGLGVGARELKAQRDPGGVRTPDEAPELENGVSVNAGDEDALDQSIGVQGAEKGDDEQLSPASEA